MRLNPNFISVFVFLLVGLIWSGGHVAWLIALGVLVTYSAWSYGVETTRNRR